MNKYENMNNVSNVLNHNSDGSNDKFIIHDMSRCF